MSIIRKEQLSNPLSASYAETASFALNANVTINTSSLVTTSSFNAYTASINNFTSSYNTGSFSGSFTGSLNGTASFAGTASYVNPLRQNVQITGSLLVSNSIDSGNRYLLGTNGGVSVDWDNAVLRDGTPQTSPSVDWNARELYDNGGNSALAWSGRLLVDTNGGTSIDWEGRALQSVNSKIVWDNDALYPDADDVVNLGLDPTNRFKRGYFSGEVSASGFTGNLTGTASYATQTLSASFASTASLATTASFATRSTSASFASNGGVTQLLAGPNISLSPTNGLGQVTITSTGGGGSSFNTATGSYGSFYDTTTQTNPVANIPRSMSFNTTDISNGVSISGSTNPFNTFIKTENAGVYNIQFSAQVEKTDSGTDVIVIWLRKNGIDLTDSATKLTLSGNGTKVVAAWNWFVSSAVNDYYQIIWVSADTGMRLYAEPINDTPGIPSVILTVNRVDQFLSNTGSFSGSFTGSLFGTASYATQALSASFASLATTASYIDPTFISASAAAAGFGSGGSINTSSFATTGSNTFNGNQTITGSLRVTGSSILPSMDSIFGGGEDGDLVSTSGTTTLTRDSFYRNITLGTSTINTGNWRLFCQNLTFSGSGAAIVNNGGAGSNGSSAGGANGAGVSAVGFIAGAQSGGNGFGPGTAGPAAGGQASAVGALSLGFTFNVPGASGKGGNTAARAGGAAGATNSVGNIKYISTIPFVDHLIRASGVSTFALVQGGTGGRGGSSGASDVATPTRGGGGGGGGAGSVVVFAETINITNAVAPVFSAQGGVGGNGGSTSVADVAGGGGGSGGSGGYIIVVYKELIGGPLVGALNASGGAGGNGGSGGVSGAAITGGNGGGAGGGGRIVLINVSTGLVTHVLGTNGANGSAATGTAGGAGATSSVTIDL